MTRALLVLACLALLGLLLAAMWLGWRHRAARQAGLLPLPLPPAEPGEQLAPELGGLYVGTAYASSWQDRVVAQRLGLRATATACLHSTGLTVDRVGSSRIFVPAEAFVSARLAPGLAGKVVGEGGLLVLRWRHGDALLDTGFRADDKSAYPAWVRTINERVPA